ncbi:exopolysaccharide biosynthesis protein [Amaricoccus tamworthensis]|uniref:exopolysaccharide biosynthesis protein n=1 Tax=Amaricoccus tamworthensis TaxID=57002 RepID=UPI003C7DC673
MAEAQPVQSVIDDLRDEASQGEVTVGKVVHAFEDRSVGVLLTLLGLLLLVPVIGGLPGAPYVMAFLILAAVAQSFLQTGGIWLPGFLKERDIPKDKLDSGLDMAEPWARRIDRITGERLTFLAGSQAARIPIFVCVVILALSLLVLGLIPAGILPAALGIFVFGLALMSRDGFLVIAGYLLTAAAIWSGLALV